MVSGFLLGSFGWFRVHDRRIHNVGAKMVRMRQRYAANAYDHSRQSILCRWPNRTGSDLKFNSNFIEPLM